MGGKFLLSFDCEGKWGMADRLNRHHHRCLTKENLVSTYESILEDLSEFDIPATFAFVMAFTLDESERRDWMIRLSDVDVGGKNWMQGFRQAEASGDFDGWFCPEAFEMVASDSRHEVGCHGFRHAIMSETSIDLNSANIELSESIEIAKMKGIRLRTFVFPRNQTGYLNLLRREGFVGYRDGVSKRGTMGRVWNLAKEFDVRSISQENGVFDDGMVRIPSGFFLNWRHGVRRIVPKSISLARWKSMLRNACMNNGVVHMYLHPHNFIDGPRTRQVFRDVLSQIRLLRDAGNLETMNQFEYCEFIEGNSN